MKTPPRAQLVIRFAPNSNTAQALTELRTAGWDAWERKSRAWQRDGPVIEAWTSRLRGEQLEVADAFAAQAQAILSDFVIRSIEADAKTGAPATLDAWQLQSQPDASKGDAQKARDLAGGRLYFGDRADAVRWASRLLRDADVPSESWHVTQYTSWSQQIRTASFAIPVGLALASAVIGMVGGFVLGGEGNDSSVLPIPSLTWMLGGVVFLVAATVRQLGSTPPASNRLAVILLYLGLAALLCGTTQLGIVVGSAWASPVAVVGVVVALLFQAMIGTPVFARMRMTGFRVPTTVILTAIGVTLFILVLNVPLALFYNAAGAFQLVGTATWGVVIGTGIPFGAAIVLAVLFAWFALHRWRNFTTLFRPRLVFGLLATGMFLFIAAAFLGRNISDGQLARQGEYGTDGLSEYMLPVCIYDPQTTAEKTPLWLVGTDGETSVLVDRSKMTRAKKSANGYPRILDADRELTYVEIDEHC